MDPRLVLKAIEGYDDALSGEAAKQEAFYRAKGKCPRCEGTLAKEFDVRTAFGHDDSVLPHALLRCTRCGFLLEPFSNVVVDGGDASKIPVEISPLVLPDSE